MSDVVLEAKKRTKLEAANKREASKPSDSAEAAMLLRAKREADRRRRKRAQAPLSLYDGIPTADPKKDALAAKLAEARNKLHERPKLDYHEDRTKVVFLDIDGVVRPLYGNQFQISSITMDGENVPIIDGETEFIPSAMAGLRHILLETGALMVLSSEWRRHPNLRDGVNLSLRHGGLPSVASDTPQHNRELTGNPLRSFAIRRAREIGEWLAAHPDVRQWVALDDIDLGQADEERQPGQPLLTPRLVQTDKTTCLTLKDAALAVDILNGFLQKPKINKGPPC